MKIQLKIIDSRITSDMLKPSTPGSAGIDLRASIHGTIKIRPGEVKEINTGICFHIGDPNYMAQIHSHSGLGAKHGLILANSTGIIDSDYQGQIIVALWNRNSNMSDVVTIGPMDRIAQLVFVPVAHPTFEQVVDFDDMTQRGSGGFGSTDRIVGVL